MPPPYPYRHTVVPQCHSCGRLISRDLGCRYCCYLREFWHKVQAAHSELSREECILIGGMVAGLQEAYVREHGRHSVRPTRRRLQRLVGIAVDTFNDIGYSFPEEPA